MRRVKVLLISITVLLSLLFLSMDGFSESPRGVTKDTIKVGFVWDLSGPVSSLGVPYLEGVRNYLRYVNVQGGIHGRKLKLIVEDDRYTIPGSLAAYKKLLYKDKVLAIIGFGSGQHKALYSTIEKDKIPVITGSWSNHVTRPLKRYSFLPADDANLEVKLMVDYLVKSEKVENLRLCYVYLDAEAGKMPMGQLEKSLNHYGLKLMRKEVVNPGELDTTSQVLSLKRIKANYVIFVTAGAGVFSLLRDARRYAYFPTFISTFHAIGEDTVNIAGEGARNLIAVGGWSSWYDNVPAIDQMKKITLKYHPEPAYAEKHLLDSRWYPKGWLTALIFVEGAKRAGKNLNNETLVGGLEQIRGLDTGGLSGPISFGPNRRQGSDSAKFNKADLGKKHFIPITDWIRPMH